MIIIFLAAAFIFAVSLSLVLNKDLFSPTKFYYFSLLLNFLNIYLYQQLPMVYMLYFMFILFGVFFSLLEYTCLASNRCFEVSQSLPVYQSNKLMVIEKIMLWCAAPSVLLQVWMIFHFGGMHEYLLSMIMKNIAWHGFGPVLLIIRFLPVLTVCFLILGLVYKRYKSPRWLFFFFIYLLVSVAIGLLSGSRGEIFNALISMFIATNYLYKRVTLVRLLIVALILFVGVVFIGSVRGSGYGESGQKVYSQSKATTVHNTFREGLIPLNLVFSKQFYDFQYGLTYLSAFTNFIPSVLWKDKPKSGGPILTHFADGYRYTGSTDYSTGAIAEGIINFGYLTGIVFGFCVITAVFLLCLFLYAKLLASLRQERPNHILIFKYLAYYSVLVHVSGAILVSEFANLVFNSVLAILAIFAASRLVAKPMARLQQRIYDGS